MRLNYEWNNLELSFQGKIWNWPGVPKYNSKDKYTFTSETWSHRKIKYFRWQWINGKARIPEKKPEVNAIRNKVYDDAFELILICNSFFLKKKMQTNVWIQIRILYFCFYLKYILFFILTKNKSNLFLLLSTHCGVVVFPPTFSEDVQNIGCLYYSKWWLPLCGCCPRRHYRRINVSSKVFKLK